MMMHNATRCEKPMPTSVSVRIRYSSAPARRAGAGSWGRGLRLPPFANPGLRDAG